MKKNDPDFQVKVCGKWILAGEHSVLRGGKALVFPLQSRYLELKYFKTDEQLDINLNSQLHPELELIFWSVLEKALKKLNIQRNNLKGRLEFESQIIFGAGMGASATLSVSLAHFFHHLQFLKETEKFDFARDLENLFHGESSGVDVAVTLLNQPLLYSRNEGFQSLESFQKPLLFLSHTGARGVTKDCVDKVKNLFLKDSKKAEAIDNKMKMNVDKFQKMLMAPAILPVDWKEAMLSSYECFEDWGLINETVRQHEKLLYQAGAQAVKLTGSGGGGYMLSYWLEPPTHVTFEMIPCFN